VDNSLLPPGSTLAHVADPTFFGGLISRWAPRFQAGRLGRALADAYGGKLPAGGLYFRGPRGVIYQVRDSSGTVEPWVTP
jgi:hypothetical protein